MSLISLVVGTRPQVIKLASLCRAFREEGLNFEVVHTGQHYDFEMDRVFFDELGLPKPSRNLGVGSGSHARQTAEIIVRLEKYYENVRPRIVVVPGDTNSALGGSLVAPKMGLKLAHVEAGLRSNQRFMPEEINRVIIDHISDYLFAPTAVAKANLEREGLAANTILTGDVMADNVLMMRSKISRAKTGLDVRKGSYVFVTIHRSENVDDKARLSLLIKAISSIPNRFGLEVVFPLHPRTKSRLKLDAEAGPFGPEVHLINPVGYLESLKLVKDARIVVTDSGGLQKEAFLLGTPVITLRSTTEWVETVESGWNRVVGQDVKAFADAMNHFMQNKPPKVDPFGYYGNGKAASSIARFLRKALET
ncbi:MAG: UDP-N-acetylglucosamine 2-epimerase (non-hydrolyzing) [Nitrososphaerota archaeon]|nr:UDP-N-acetylglucosamine 2-epimerase (non-hydrolyzing) [Nitrososphaerota archaeon]